MSWLMGNPTSSIAHNKEGITTWWCWERQTTSTRKIITLLYHTTSCKFCDAKLLTYKVGKVANSSLVCLSILSLFIANREGNATCTFHIWRSVVHIRFQSNNRWISRAPSSECMVGHGGNQREGNSTQTSQIHVYSMSFIYLIGITLKYVLTLCLQRGSLFCRKADNIENYNRTC